MLLVKEIYKLTNSFPQDELFGLTNQLRRASVSIPSNIAEGYGRKTQKDKLQFLIVAYGSSLEIETQLLIAIELNFVSDSDTQITRNLLTEVIKMLNKLTSSIREHYK